MRRLLAVTALPVVLAAALVGSTGALHRAVAAPVAAQDCILGIICLPSSSPSATPTPSSASPTASPTPTVASPTASPAPSASATTQPAAAPTTSSSAPAASPSVSPSGSASPSPTGSPSPSPTGTSSPSPSASGSASPSPTATAQKSAADPAGTVAAAATSVLTAGSADITDFHYVGNVDMPIAGGSEQMMEFTADSIDLTGNVTVTVTQDETTVTTVTASQDFSGGVTLYATQLSGALLGIPLTLTPATITVANLLKLPNAGELQLANLITGAIPLTMTGVTTDQFLISGGTQVTTQLSMS
jgi:hypothetical protein